MVGALERARAAETPRLEFGENPRSLTIESEKMSKSHFSI